MNLLASSTHPRWFATSGASVGALLSDHLHCERKAAENALTMVRRYAYDAALVERLTRLAHEETSHLVQVVVLMNERGLAVRSDGPNNYARGLLAEVRGDEPWRRVDSLLCAALIEARSHERLELLARGFGDSGDQRLAEFYGVLAAAEARHAEIYVELALAVAPEAAVSARLSELSHRESEILATLAHGPRVH